MPDRKKIWVPLLGLVAATGLGLHLARPSPPSLRPEPARIPSAGDPGLASIPPPALTHGAIDSKEERPFWEDAAVPDPGTDMPFIAAAIPPSTGEAPRDYQAEVHALETGGETPKLADSLLLWFGRDPAAATQWLNQTGRFEDLAPRLGTFALEMGGRDQMDTALAWVDAIPEEGVRHEARLRLYAQQVRRKKATRETLEQAGFGTDDIALILSGSLND